MSDRGDGRDEGVTWTAGGDMEEPQLEKLAKRLGARAAENLDVEKAAQGVLQRLRTEPPRVVWWRRMPRLQSVAAAAVIVLTAGIVTVSQIVTGSGELADPPPLAELQALTSDELEQVFDSLIVDAPVYEYTGFGLQDLNEGQLQELLNRMEG